MRTTEQLKQMFQESRERHRLQKVELSKQRKQQRLQYYKDLCKQADELIRQDKNKLMEQLQALAPKRSQKQNKCPSAPPNVYHSNLIEREPNDRDLFLTRKELQEWERENWQCINWEAWDRIVEETRQILNSI